jgi:hypothetical protein
VRAADLHDAHRPRKGARFLLNFPEEGTGDGFIPQLFHLRQEFLSPLFFGDLSEKRESLLGFFLVEFRDGKPRMDNHPIPELDVFKEGKIDPDFGPEIVHFPLTGAFDMSDFGRNP